LIKTKGNPTISKIEIERKNKITDFKEKLLMKYIELKAVLIGSIHKKLTKYHSVSSGK
jgi:hypothetical protein